MNRCYIALGSNLDKPLEQVRKATVAIASLGTITAQSSWYRSTAIGPGNQPDYINGVLLLTTPLEPHTLLSALQDIENQQGRVRQVRWGARTLDLDILLFNNETINTVSLVVPHPRIRERAFVCLPLAEISPELIFPDGAPLSDTLASLSCEGLEKLP